MNLHKASFVLRKATMSSRVASWTGGDKHTSLPHGALSVFSNDLHQSLYPTFPVGSFLSLAVGDLDRLSPRVKTRAFHVGSAFDWVLFALAVALGIVFQPYKICRP